MDFLHNTIYSGSFRINSVEHYNAQSTCSRRLLAVLNYEQHFESLEEVLTRKCMGRIHGIGESGTILIEYIE